MLAADLRGSRGYEEGLVEGLAQLVMRERAGMSPLDVSYPYYVAAYRAVAAVMGIDLEALWRALWVYPTGGVRREFVDVIDRMRSHALGQAMTQRQRDRLQALADRAFASGLSGAAAPEQAMLERTFRVVFR